MAVAAQGYLLAVDSFKASSSAFWPLLLWKWMWQAKADLTEAPPTNCQSEESLFEPGIRIGIKYKNMKLELGIISPLMQVKGILKCIYTYFPLC